ncbi:MULTISPECIES: hypothetical protein [Sphingobium]|uniref:hypothetical protein n=1 Tax=Sphingobium TaxID=165695 RepID=UPI0011AF2318|nr:MULTISPECIES: hypothetical protein [Sphingobium]
MSLKELAALELSLEDAELIEAATAAAIKELAKHIQVPAETRHRSNGMMDMMVARPSGNVAWSFHINNLVRANPISPTAITAGVATYALAAAAGTLLAFIVAVTTLAFRSVNRAEAMTLHLIHRIARDDGTFLLEDVIGAADQLREEYGLIKNSQTDIESYVAELLRAGCVSEIYNGYRVEERILITPF